MSIPELRDNTDDLERIVEIEIPADDAEVKVTNRGRVLAVRVPDPRRKWRVQGVEVVESEIAGIAQQRTSSSPRLGLLARRDRRMIVHALYRQGLSYGQIAKAVGCGVTTAQEDVNLLLDEWAAERKGAEDRYRAAAALELDWVKSEARAAWMRSREEEITTRTKTRQVERQKKDGSSTSPEKMSEGQMQKRQRVGDPRFLDRYAWAVEAEVKLYGLNAPEEKKVEIRASAELLKEMMEAAGRQAPEVVDVPSDGRTIEMQKWLDSPSGQPTVYLPIAQGNGSTPEPEEAVIFDPRRDGGNGKNGSGE